MCHEFSQSPRREDGASTKAIRSDEANERRARKNLLIQRDKNRRFSDDCNRIQSEAGEDVREKDGGRSGHGLLGWPGNGGDSSR